MKYWKPRQSSLLAGRGVPLVNASNHEGGFCSPGPWVRFAAVLAVLLGTTWLSACASQGPSRSLGLRNVAIPADVRYPRGRGVPHRALQAYNTNQVRAAEKRHAAARHALSQLPGVVAVRPGYGVVYVYTHRPAAVPREYDGLPVKALPPEFIGGLSEEWVTPDQLPPLGQGD